MTPVAPAKPMDGGKPPADLPPQAKANQATVVVSLPADANLYVDDQNTPMSNTTRTFVTPELTMGKDYFYTMKVQATRNGELVSKTARVVVRAGETSRVDFGNLSDAAVVKTMRPAPAKLTVMLPADAKLFVDNVECPLTSETRSFETPKLDAGKKYAYTLRAEVMRDGKPVKVERKVIMTAGEEVLVKFDEMTAAVAAR